MAVQVQLQQPTSSASTTGIAPDGAGITGIALRPASGVAIAASILPLVAARVDSAFELGSAGWVLQALSGSIIWHLTPDHMTTIKIPEGQSVTLWARLTSAERDLILQGDINSIVLNLFDTSSETQTAPVFQETLDVGSVMFTALQLTGGWRRDADGYAFKYVLPGSVLTEGGRTYRMEIVFRTRTEGTVSIVGFIHTDGLYTTRAELGG